MGTYHVWTAKDRDFLRANYRRLGRDECARLLGRLPQTIDAAAVRFRAAGRHRRPCTDWPELRRLHARGLTDPEMASRLNCCRELVSYHRRRLELPANSTTVAKDRLRQKTRQATREQCREAGVPSLVSLRWLVGRVQAVRAGWPEDCTPRQVEILERLSRSPARLTELGLRIWGSSSALAKLCRRGLVACDRYSAPDRFGHRTVGTYRLADGVGRRVSDEERCA